MSNISNNSNIHLDTLAQRIEAMIRDMRLALEEVNALRDEQPQLTSSKPIEFKNKKGGRSWKI
jgi:hypothetical protein